MPRAISADEKGVISLLDPYIEIRSQHLCFGEASYRGVCLLDDRS